MEYSSTVCTQPESAAVYVAVAGHLTRTDLRLLQAAADALLAYLCGSAGRGLCLNMRKKLPGEFHVNLVNVRRFFVCLVGKTRRVIEILLIVFILML